MLAPRLNRRSTIGVTVVLSGILLLITLCAPRASAAYDGGRIIDDTLFLDAKSMSISDIQNFLAARGSGLKDMTFTLQCYGSGSQERQWYTAAGARCDTPIPASEIIYYAAQVYGVSPKVILATMQKEQSLTTATNPTIWQLTQAMGYACPTSGSCSSSSSFPYQIDSGTWALRFHYERARGNMNWWYTSTSWTCGTEKNLYKPNLYPNQNVRFYDTNGTHYATIFIQNPATSTMYCYTPHAYNNPQGLYGRAPYGNTGLYYSGSYNFVYYFELWFNSTKAHTSNVVLENGIYVITSTTANKALDVTGAQTANGTKIQIYDSNGSAAQQWQIVRQSDGLYKIRSIFSSKYLDVINASTAVGAQTQIYTGNSSCAQKWSIVYSGYKYYIFNKCSSLSLDITSANFSNGTKMQLYPANWSNAQSWNLTSKSTAALPNGIYSISTTANKALDVTGAQTANGTKIQIYDSNGSAAQQWQIVRQSDGLYKIRSIFSSKYLDVINASTAVGAQTQIYTGNSSCAQKWSFTTTSNGLYQIRSACSENVLGVAGDALSTPNTPLETQQISATSLGQSWNILSLDAQPIPNGIYSISTTANKALDVTGAQTANGTKIQIYDSNGSAAQQWQIVRQSDGLYKIRSIFSSKYLDVINASTAVGAQTQIYTGNSSCAQKWSFTTTSNGLYQIRSACSENVLDIVNGAVGKAGTSVQTYKKNQTSAQTFYLGLP